MAATAVHGVFILYWSMIGLLTLTAITTTTAGFSLELIPITSPELAYFPKNLAQEEMHHRIGRLSLEYADYIKSISSPGAIINSSNKVTPAEIEPSVLRPSSAYAVRLAIGTPPFEAYLLLDTGSDLTWIQCQGCTNCFQVAGGNFKPESSGTFSYMSENDPRCGTVRGHKCVYVINYIRARTSGVLSIDNFSFPGTRGSDTVQNVVFGCGLDNEGVSFGSPGPHNKIGGVFGLGAGPGSLLMRLAPPNIRRFSYCLQPWTRSSATTYLSFGRDAKIVHYPERRIQRTQLLRGQIRYYVTMRGISIAGNRLPIDETLFQMKNDGSGGFAVDSGSAATVLVKGAYSILEREMKRYLQGRYGWVPLSPDPRRNLLCYPMPAGNSYTLPSMTFHFDNAPLVLHPHAVFERFRDTFCMIIKPIDEPGPNLLGAFQQANHRFLFDLTDYTLSFSAESCGQN